MHVKLDYILGTIFILVQWRISALLLRRWPGRWGVACVGAGNILLAGTYVLSISELVSRYHLPPRIALSLGAVGVAYLVIATSVLVLQTLMQWAKRVVTSPDLDPSRRRLLDMAGLALVTSPIAVLGYGTLVQRTNFQVREVDVPVPDLAPGLEGLRLLQLSDIHMSVFLSEAEFARVVDAANGLRPHVALVTGDLISSLGDPLDACLRQIGRLRSDAGTFGCLGNHERYARAETYTAAAAAKLGIRFLRRQNQVLVFGGAPLNLAGVDYEPLRRDWESYLIGAKSLKAPGALNILLSHNPDVFPQAALQGYNLLLAGHTHGGQVTIEILDQSINPARFLTPFVSGLYRKGKAAAYVTRGIGTIGLPTRVGAPPEITLLRLRKA